MPMIARETLDDVSNFDEFIELCCQVGCDTCDNIMSRDEIDALILEYITETDWDSWEDIQDFLDDKLCIYDSETGYYVNNGYWEYSELYYDDLEDYKADLERFLVDRGYIIEDAEDPEDVTTEEDDDDEEEIESGAALEEMLMGGM